MPLDNVTRIMERASDFVEYHHRYPNVLIIGMELKQQMYLSINTTTLQSELDRIKTMIQPTGYKMFDIVAYTDDIEGFILTYATVVSSYALI